MSDINEIGQKPEELNSHESNLKGINIFFGEEEARLFASLGREVTEAWVQESFLFYKIDLKKTSVHPLYGESKVKVYETPVEIYGRINTEPGRTSLNNSGMLKKAFGKLTAHVYIQHLEELGLIENDAKQSMVTKIKVGDFIGHKGQFYRIIEDGFAQTGNQHSWAGDRRFYITIEATEVDDDQFNAR